MAHLSLSASFTQNPMTRAILDGRVKPAGVDWSLTPLHPSEMFWRQLRFGDFDVSEMSLSSLFISAAQGRRDWVALPIFTTRRFFHTEIVIRTDAGISCPADLAGKRVGVPEYQQTAAVWIRGALQHEFGVTADQMRWYMERSPERSHGGATGFVPPDGVEFHYVGQQENLGSMLASGALDAVLFYIADDNLVDKTRQDAQEIASTRSLFDDPAAEGIRYYRKTSLLPVNHCVVVRADILDAHPWVALNIYSAFLEAKKIVTDEAAQLLTSWRQLGALAADQREDIGGLDPLPYGIQCQSEIFNALAEYQVEQGLTARQVRYDEVFAASTLDL